MYLLKWFKFSKIPSVSIVSVSGFVLLVGGLGIALFASQQQQENRSQAATGDRFASVYCISPTNTYAARVVSSGTEKQIPSSLRSTYCPATIGPGPVRIINCTQQTIVTDNVAALSSSFTNSDSQVCALFAPAPPAPNYCEQAGYSCTGVTSHSIGQCPTGTTPNTSPSCGSDYKICCVPNAAPPPPVNNPPPPSGGGDAQHIGKSCSTPQGSGTCQYRNSYNCSGSWVVNHCPGSTNVVCCVPPPNQPPTANAGEDQTITLPVSRVTLDGSGSRDSDGSITVYAWTKIDGPSVGTIVSPTTQTTGVTDLETVGVYTFKLEVTDNKGVKHSDTMTVTVNEEPNQAPTANAGTDKTLTLPASSVTLSGSGTDPDEDTVSYAWSYVSGPKEPNIVDEDTDTTNVTGLTEEGTYVFELIVTDGKGGTDEDTVEVKVTVAPTTTLKFDLLLQGIGKAGDNANRGESGGGTKPPVLKNLQRFVLVKLISIGGENEDKEYVFDDVLVTYNSGRGSFVGEITFEGTDEEFAEFESGPYVVSVKFPQSLSRIVPPGYRVITRGTVNTIPQLRLETGDINGDDKRDIKDYNALRECYEDFEEAEASCRNDETKKALADINNDGEVNILDLTLLQREMSVTTGVNN